MSPLVAPALSRSAPSYAVRGPMWGLDRLDEILALTRANFSWGPAAEAWHRWANDASPFGPNGYWFIETEPQETVGFTALMPRRMQLLGRVAPVGQAANLNVKDAHRGTAAAVKLQRAVVSHVDGHDLGFVFGISRNAVAVQRRAGYAEVGACRRWVKLFRFEPKLRQRIPWTWPRRLMARLLEAGAWCVSRETRQPLPRGWDVVTGLPFDARFDRLWQAAAPSYGIATERSSAYLTWRFGCDPQRQYETLTVCDARGELRGAVVFVSQDPGETLPLAALVDMFAVDQEAIEAVLLALCRRLRRQRVMGVHTLYLGSPLVERALHRCGFLPRPSDYRVLVHLHPRLQPHAAELLTPTAWHVTEAEQVF